jgi:plasmid stabilization system protein ParE
MAEILGHPERVALSRAGASLSKVVWSTTALAHLRFIRAYLEQFNPRAAQELAEGLIAAGDSLATFPHRTSGAGYRHARTGYRVSLYHSLSHRRRPGSHIASPPHFAQANGPLKIPSRQGQMMIQGALSYRHRYPGNIARSLGATSRAKRSRLWFICSGRMPGGTAQVTMSVREYSRIKEESSRTQ